MTTVPTLPAALHSKFIQIERRIRAIRILRGAAACALVLTGLFVAAYLVEATMGWSVVGLRAANVGFMAVTLAGITATLLQWRRGLPRLRLAALIERQFPELGERLASTVELQQSDLETHGSSELVRGLREETVHQAEPLDFRQAHPARPTMKLAAAAAVLGLIVLAPLFGSERYARFGHRLVFAWSPSVYGYTIDVDPGDQYVGRGRSAAVVVRLTATDAGAKLPSSCLLISREVHGVPRRLRMEPGQPGCFSHTWSIVDEAISYRIEAGDLASATYQLTPVDPVALAPGSPSVTIMPPPYVDARAMPAREHTGLTPFSTLQFSRVRFEFAFDRPAQRATLRWRADGHDRVVDLALSQDRTAAVWETLAGAAGPQAATLKLEAEHGIVSEYALPAWSVWVDEPPWFSAAPVFSFSDPAGRPKTIAANEIIPLKTVVEDQVGVAHVALEYRVNDGPIKFVSLAEGKGQVRVAVETAWRLQDVVKIGDQLQCRLRATDNRRLPRGSLRGGDQAVPDGDLTPNIAYLPAQQGGADAWWTFAIVRQADSLAKQEATAQRDEFKERIERIRKQLAQERQQVQKVKLASHQQPVLTAAQANQLDQAHKLNQANQQELRELAQTAGRIAGLQNLARLGWDIADKELGVSDRALEAGRSKSLEAGKRDRELGKAEQALWSALQRLEDLQKVNELLARERTDVTELNQLAAEEKELAKQADDLAAQPKMNQQDLERIRAEQAKIAARLQKLAEQIPQLQQAAQKMRQAQARKLAQEALSLAMKQRKLSQESAAKWQAELTAKFAGLAQRQRDLAGEVGKLGSDIKQPTSKDASASPHRAALSAADQLRDGKIESAMSQQQAAEVALQALAKQIDQASATGRDPRSAVQKLARLQEDLLKQLEKVGDEFKRVPLEQTRKRLAEIAQEQKALHDAVGQLDVPPAAQAARNSIQGLTGAAAALLRDKDAYGGHQKMEEARDALRAWAGGLPNTTPAPPAAKETPEAAAAKNQSARARQLAKEQYELRAAAAKLLKELGQTQGASPQFAKQQEDVSKLAQTLMELAQKAGAEGKQGANEAAHAAETARKEMSKSLSDKEQGRMEQSKQSEAEAALQLEMAGKKLDASAQAMGEAPMGANSNNKTDDEALQQAFQESQMKLEQAGDQLQQQPQRAGPSMQQAAQALAKTAKRAEQQMASQSQPLGGGDPAQAFQPGGANSSGEALPEAIKAHAGKSWGELPGELRTRIVQDLRARYGEEYGPIIQRYFQQIADVPGAKKSR